VFRGQYEHTMDAKGRISLPARLREVLTQQSTGEKRGTKVILTRTFQRCLVVYPLDKWLRFEERIRELPQFDPSVQRLKRVYVAGAVECVLDSHGRLLVPQGMRDFAGLGGESVWVGQLDTIELWSQGRWREVVADALEDPEGLAQAMAALGI
jgi:MraZ protein